MSSMKTAIDALNTILQGSENQGRWIDVLFGNALDGAKDAEPDGYYADDAPPPAFCVGADSCPDMPGDVDMEGLQYLKLGRNAAGNLAWLRPATWEIYTRDEQVDWIETVARIARETLAKIAADQGK